MGNVPAVSDGDFRDRVLGAEKPVLVDFWATWCGPCKMISPVVEQIADEFAGKAEVYKMDVDANPQTPQQLGIMSMPTVVLFKAGRPVDRLVGYRPNVKADLKERLTALL
jgi:thioredoxin